MKLFLNLWFSWPICTSSSSSVLFPVKSNLMYLDGAHVRMRDQLDYIKHAISLPPVNWRLVVQLHECVMCQRIKKPKAYYIWILKTPYLLIRFPIINFLHKKYHFRMELDARLQTGALQMINTWVHVYNKFQLTLFCKQLLNFSWWNEGSLTIQSVLKYTYIKMVGELLFHSAI